jgi:hypothetical protein
VGPRVRLASAARREARTQLAKRGSALVTLDALPAARLLFGDGDAIEVRGSGLELDPDAKDPQVLSHLDGFEDVDVMLDSFRAGPFGVESFELTRNGTGPYHLVSAGQTTGRDLVAYGASRLGVPGGPLLGYLSGRVPESERPIPVDLDMELESEGGRVRVVSGGGSIAGLPTGPLAQLLTEAIVVRL